MSSGTSGIAGAQAIDSAADVRLGLARELDLYRRLDALAERSLGILAEGGEAPALIHVLEEKRCLLDEVRELRGKARVERRNWNRQGGGSGQSTLAEFDRMTEEMETVLRETIRKEEEIELRLRSLGWPSAGATPRDMAVWRSTSQEAAVKTPEARLMGVG